MSPAFIGRTDVHIGLYIKKLHLKMGAFIMVSRISDLRCKEIINVADGSRYGYLGDVEVDTESGLIKALIVPGRLRLFGLLGRGEDKTFPWDAVRRIGEDIILVETSASTSRRTTHNIR